VAVGVLRGFGPAVLSRSSTAGLAVISHGFAPARMIEVESWVNYAAGSECIQDTTDVSLVLRRSLVLVALLVASSVSMVALAPSQRDAVRRR
jgi:hypothetical protein